MKRSNFCAPRTMAEAQFMTWADPIERPTQRTVSAGWWLVAVVLVAGMVVAGAML